MMSKERELLEETLVVLEMVHMDECDLYFAIRELLTQPEQEPFFQKTYCADDLDSILEDFYEKLNKDDCVITVDENNLTQGIFEVTINWVDDESF